MQLPREAAESARRISVIVPVYNEAENVEHAFEAVKAVFEESLSHFRWQVVFVDDGSADASWDRIRRLSESHPETVLGVSLARNFGKELALTAGVDAAGDVDAVVCMDADLQHPPEIIPEFVEKWERGADIVAGIRRSVADYSLLKRAGSKAFYCFMRHCSEVDIPANSTDFRLLDRKVVNSLRLFKERARMFRGLVDWMGFRRDFVEFDAPSRLNGDGPAYSMKKLVRLAVNSITSFSLLPLRITGHLGMLVSAGAALLLVYMLITDMFDLSFYTPLAYVVVTLTFLMGVVLCALGLLALYIGHIHTEVVGRPLYVLRETTSDNGRCACDS